MKEWPRQHLSCCATRSIHPSSVTRFTVVTFGDGVQGGENSDDSLGKTAMAIRGATNHNCLSLPPYGCLAFCRGPQHPRQGRPRQCRSRNVAELTTYYTGQKKDCGARGGAPVGWVIFTEIFVRPSKEPLGFCGSSLTINRAMAKRTV